MSQLSEVTATSQSLTIILPSRFQNRKSNNVITFKRTKMHRHILGGMRLANPKYLLPERKIFFILYNNPYHNPISQHHVDTLIYSVHFLSGQTYDTPFLRYS